jgi:hypothetical protein
MFQNNPLKVIPFCTLKLMMLITDTKSFSVLASYLIAPQLIRVGGGEKLVFLTLQAINYACFMQGLIDVFHLGELKINTFRNGASLGSLGSKQPFKKIIQETVFAKYLTAKNQMHLCV